MSSLFSTVTNLMLSVYNGSDWARPLPFPTLSYREEIFMVFSFCDLAQDDQFQVFLNLKLFYTSYHYKFWKEI